MQVWCFVSKGGLWALSADETGGALPDEMAPWTFLKAAVLDDIQDDERQAQALIREFGYCCFDAGVDG